MKLTTSNFLDAGKSLGSGALLFALLAVPCVMQAQTPVTVGFPANFDAFNTTGAPINGFEIEADGIQASDVTRVFGGVWVSGQPCVIRYCQGSIVPFAGGVYIRWMSPWDPAAQQFTLSTPVSNGTVTAGESCWTMGLAARYPAAGCEHFGISTTINPTNVVYRWLVPDPNNLGQLTYFTGTSAPPPGFPAPPPIPVAIPQPVINVNPPAQVGAAPVVVFEIQAPPPPPAPRAVPQYGDAQWVKVYKLEVPNAVDLNDLMGGNPVVPEGNNAAPETPWKLLQYNPNSRGNSGILINQALLGNGSHAVVRRYEHYQYNGVYDPLSHEALCIDTICAAPQADELGQMIGAQNAAVNLEVPSITVVKTGSGTVSSASPKMNCGATCTATVAAGSTVTLTASAPGNAVFNGWGGACSGTQATCTVTVNGAVNVTAKFTTVNTLSIGHGGNGVVSGTPNGEFSTFITCGSSCSAKFQQGTTVTLTATPAAGANFTGWSGACAGLAPTCSVTIAADTKVQANFK
ncbi:MAG TPA: hypothetical protein VNY05_43370 [Candidatus Acidoferrales bacterium]|nr:hypothetical protein [Candidatus Acidoferrales bacterium]